jgi:hypothetical protein
MIYAKTFRFGGTRRKPHKFVPVTYYVEKQWVRVFRGCNAYEVDLGHDSPFLIVDWHHSGSHYPGRITVQIGFNYSLRWRRRLRRIKARFRSVTCRS